VCSGCLAARFHTRPFAVECSGVSPALAWRPLSMERRTAHTTAKSAVCRGTVGFTNVHPTRKEAFCQFVVNVRLVVRRHKLQKLMACTRTDHSCSSAGHATWRAKLTVHTGELARHHLKVSCVLCCVAPLFCFLVCLLVAVLRPFDRKSFCKAFGFIGKSTLWRDRCLGYLGSSL